MSIYKILPSLKVLPSRFRKGIVKVDPEEKRSFEFKVDGNNQAQEE